MVYVQGKASIVLGYQTTDKNKIENIERLIDLGDLPPITPKDKYSFYHNHVYCDPGLHSLVVGVVLAEAKEAVLSTQIDETVLENQKKDLNHYMTRLAKQLGFGDFDPALYLIASTSD